MGDSGAGKSTFNLELERDLWDSYNKYKRRIPLFVTLPTIDKPEQDLIAKHLRKYDFNEEQIRELKSDREFILICDGYDECHQQSNLYTSNRLNQPGEWNVQMVISCRSEFLGHDYRRRFQPGDRNDWTGGALLQEAAISPFSEKQIKHYIEIYVARNAPHWKVEDYLQALDRIPGLKDLVKNPFLLTLSLSVLPNMVDLGKNLSLIKVTRIALYDNFVKQWVDRGMARLHDKKLSESDAMAFEGLCSDGFSQNAIQYTKDLSVAIFENQDGDPVVEYSSLRDKNKWQHVFFSQVDGRNLLREACPIVRIGNSNQYRFIHRSVLEYGLALAVFEPQAVDKNEQSKAEPATGAREQRRMGGALIFNGLNSDRGLSAANESFLDFTSPLCRRSFVNEPSIIRFLAERVQQKP
ncbi:WD_REPEATS_REGION domain-containing protein, partial [Dissophora globulifera]